MNLFLTGAGVPSESMRSPIVPASTLLGRDPMLLFGCVKSVGADSAMDLLLTAD